MPRRVSRTVRRSSRAASGFPFDLPRVTAAERRRASRLAEALARHYPGAKCALAYSTPHELLVATILSAQTTDAAVNKATPALFARFPTPADYARATPADIEPYVRSLGFFRNKAKAVYLAMKEVVARFGGEVPRTMDDLLSLHGVARKTANVVLGNAFGVNDGFVVDTHIDRLSRRFCLAPRDAAIPAVERRLMALFPREQWCALSHRFIAHGRSACTARGRGCADHPICREFGGCCERRDAVTAPRGPRARSTGGAPPPRGPRARSRSAG